MIHSILILVAFLSLAMPAMAIDGVLEINQTCAVETGCFPGDTPGYPVTIGSTTSVAGAGSFRLTSNLTTTDVNLDGIVLSSFRVTIDFNGFSLRPPSAALGTGHGVTATGTDGFFGTYATIKNGVIRGFPGRGVSLAAAKGVRVEDMTFESNRGGGIALGSEARVLRNGFSTNGGTTEIGLRVGPSSLVLNNVVSNSGITGIFTSTTCVISNNTVTGSGGRGIELGAYSIVSGNTVNSSGQQGIAAGVGSTVSGNSVSSNGSSGILDFGNVSVYGNTVANNSGAGLALSNGSGYRGNTILSSNSGGTVSNGIDLGGNLCGLSTTCP